MTTTAGPVADLERALHATATIIDGVPDDRRAAQSPCAGWTVTDVVEHVLTGNLVVARALGPDLADAPEVAESLAPRFRSSSEALVAALSLPDALSGTVTVPFGTVPVPVAVGLRTVEALVHGWDVAVGSGQDTGALPEDLAVAGIAFTESMFTTTDRARLPFAPAVAVDPAAPAIERLAGLLGRTDPRG
ncbi:TIGR03086 family metal-binding protein [Actinomycetospora endophytica]|uniref:TIGR03086 family metal-binding protein n=1 Tax=Actinomycetospora endophytica TaxID=2291215 RepID=A0ABS8P540_9PSEU|nr:TIGR03086 family metal-binding protein [Actinomycetospora endophytica]MCD2193364.1 TIGR03086 family metal-binding protein [Actinomycetospora endophytica]